jgi:MYXO-CTERM domain-containing protein
VSHAALPALDPLGWRWDRSGVPDFGSDDDAPAPRRGAVRPPPSLAPDDAPATIDVPRMEPPPPSLEAMVQSAQRSNATGGSGSSWWLWALLVVAAVAVTGYVMR